MSNPQEGFSKTLNLPVTDFPMRASLAEKEPLMIKKWTENKIYEQILEKNKGHKKFVMPDGPPYANGSIHVGHVLNKVLKDIIIKYKNLQGFRAPFIPGWDCHGLPIELKVTKELGDKRKDMTKKDIRELCRKEANHWINHQREQFIRLGIIADWENPYLTLQPQYEAEEVRELGRILKNNILYRGQKPVFWCPTLQTALADTEVEYKDIESPSIYVKFDLTDETTKALGISKAAVVIWTTTPWTLPANYGISFHPDFEYGLYETVNGNIIIATKLKDAFVAKTSIELSEPIKTFTGSEFENLEAQHPFINRKSKLINGTHVTLEAGTGAVHTAPAHGLDDYNVGQKYDLPMESPVNEGGLYTEAFPEMKGVHIWKANKLLVEVLRENGHLLHFSTFVHSYPHNWRSKTPLIYRATPQWFISVDNEEFSVRKKALKSIEEDIKFYPAWGKARLKAMVEDRPDWCISRQRIWGVPIPVFYCDSCGESLMKPEILNKVADQMEKGAGIEEYFEAPKGHFTEGYSCEACGGKEFTASQDILDVWFDSGVCHAAVQDRRDGMETPADIYLEGSDQHRGWFQTSLLSSLASKGIPPFKALVTHGFTRDEVGAKMSKSVGNTIDPQKVINESGAEILRLWVSYVDYGQDVTVGPEIFKKVSESYRRIRNTMRFLLGVVGTMKESDLVDLKDLDFVDKWALHQFNQLIEEVTVNFDNFSFHKVYHALNQYFTVQLSATYMDILKDRLYCDSKESDRRRSSMTVMYHITRELTKMMAPILSFLSDEIYDYLPGDKKDSIWLESFPKPFESWNFNAEAEEFKVLLGVRGEVTKKLEDLRKDKVIGSSLEAEVKLALSGEDYKVAKKYATYLDEIFIVSKVELVEGPANIQVGKFDASKCERCWKVFDELSSKPGHTNVCQRCSDALG
jgi:isoleucyl-tRNA synthetase